tara:strand:- start:2819 stop:3193 length:375 start_codon:yes stop_codon:yes gene_type:complete
MMKHWEAPERLGYTGEETEMRKPTQDEVNKAIMQKMASEDVLASVGNHDKHYSDKDVEPITIIEETMERLTKAGIGPKSSLNICLGLKYYLRAGMKDSESASKDLEKGLNYMYRAEMGEWIKRF